MITLKSIQAELNTIEELINKDITFKTARLDELVDLPLNGLEEKMCPAVFLAVNSLKGQSESRIINLALIFQYVFLANRIHRLINDEDVSEDVRQYSVLVGDFVFGQTFSRLCEKDVFIYTRDFIKAIETMNEGVLLRWRFKNKSISLKDYKLILGKERAYLTALAGRLGAQVSGIQESLIPKIEEFGYLLGMAWAAWEESLGVPLVQEYLMKVKALIFELKDHLPVRPLQELYEFFIENTSPNAKLASN